MADALTFVGLAACACFMFVVMSVPTMRPKSSSPCCAVVLVIWFWGTTVWATSTKRLLVDLGTRPQGPACWWLTMLPHLLSCGPLVLVAAAQEGADMMKDHMLSLFVKPSWEMLCWYVAGGCYFYGQLFTVFAFAGASPLVVMVVKALEPLITASLAILALGQEVRWALLAGILVACCGIILAITGCPAGSNSLLAHQSLHTSMAAAFMANLGFGSRACMVKRAYGRSRVTPLIAISTITVTGVIVGMLPLLFCPSLLDFPSRSPDGPTIISEYFEEVSTPHFGLWIATAVSYLVYQTASLFLLEAFAVESHALLVAAKHVFTALSATLMVGGHLSGTTLLGCSVLLLGILLYTASPAPAAPSAKALAAEPPEVAPLRAAGLVHAGLESLPSASRDRPPVLLFAICLVLVVSGTVVLGVSSGTVATSVAEAARLARPAFADTIVH